MTPILNSVKKETKEKEQKDSGISYSYIIKSLNAPHPHPNLLFPGGWGKTILEYRVRTNFLHV